MVPPDNGRRPAMQFNAVDLPHPDGPSSATNSPRRIVIVSSLSAATAGPPAPAKRRVTRSRRSSLKSCFMGTEHCHPEPSEASPERSEGAAVDFPNEGPAFTTSLQQQVPRAKCDALGMTNTAAAFCHPERKRGTCFI